MPFLTINILLAISFQIFDVNALDLAKVGKSFGFTIPPNINLQVMSSKGGKVVRRGGGGGYGAGYQKNNSIQKTSMYRNSGRGGRGGGGRGGGRGGGGRGGGKFTR